MRNTEDIGGGDEFAAVPIRNRFSHGAEIDQEGDEKNATRQISI